jgi:hypothetical protein
VQLRNREEADEVGTSGECPSRWDF